MYLEKFLARFVGLTVAGVESAGENPICPKTGESFYKPSNKRGKYGFYKEICRLPREAELGRLFVCCKNAFGVAVPHPGVLVLSMGLAARAEKKMVTDPTTERW